MNLYLVVSEELTETLWENEVDMVGHEESYRIAELVMAAKASQAKYLAWRRDQNTFSSDIREMPQFSCHFKGIFPKWKDAAVVSDDSRFEKYWDKAGGESEEGKGL